MLDLGISDTMYGTQLTRLPCTREVTWFSTADVGIQDPGALSPRKLGREEKLGMGRGNWGWWVGAPVEGKLMQSEVVEIREKC